MNKDILDIYVQYLVQSAIQTRDCFVGYSTAPGAERELEEEAFSLLRRRGEVLEARMEDEGFHIEIRMRYEAAQERPVQLGDVMAGGPLAQTVHVAHAGIPFTNYPLGKLAGGDLSPRAQEALAEIGKGKINYLLWGDDKLVFAIEDLPMEQIRILTEEHQSSQEAEAREQGMTGMGQ